MNVDTCMQNYFISLWLVAVANINVTGMLCLSARELMLLLCPTYWLCCSGLPVRDTFLAVFGMRCHIAVPMWITSVNTLFGTATGIIEASKPSLL